MKDNDLILPAKGKLLGRSHRLIRDKALSAVLWNNFVRVGDHCFPKLILKATDAYDEDDCLPLVVLKFQRHNASASWGGFVKVGGVLADVTTGIEWSTCYAGKIEADLSRRADVLKCGLDLLERAEDSLEQADKPYMLGCELSSMIKGLLNIGIPVIIKDGRLTAESKPVETAQAVAG